MVRLIEKKALVTGGASGIGRATAELFTQEGAWVALLDIDAQQGGEVVGGILDNGGKAIFVQADVSQDSDCRSAVSQVLEAFGGIDILYNGAGVIRRATAVELDEDDWDLVMDVNAKSVYLMCKYIIPIMVQAGGGAIVNTASGWGLVGGPQAVAYCAAKGAVVQLTRAMAIDHGPEHIRVNSPSAASGIAGRNRTGCPLPGQRFFFIRFRHHISRRWRRLGGIRGAAKLVTDLLY